MARWRLQVAHYIFTDPPTEWEYKETDRSTGKQNRAVSKVPRFLDPKDPSDCNRDGDVVVTDGNNAQRGDIRFVGSPTPDMEPLDKEAEEISQKFIDSGAWTKPAEGEEYGEGLIKRFMAQIAALETIPRQALSAGQVDAASFKNLQEQVKALMESNAQLQAKLAEKAPVAVPKRA